MHVFEQQKLYEPAPESVGTNKRMQSGANIELFFLFVLFCFVVFVVFFFMHYWDIISDANTIM